MNTLNRVVLLTSIFIIVSCGGGGGGGGSSDDGSGGGYGNTNRTPTITNTTTSFSVMENQTAAFTITATDPDMDSLTYSLAGNDGGIFSVSSSGVVTFNTAPDYENPTDSDTNNVYEVTGRVSDGSLTATRDFTVTVTNDTSDDVTTEGYDGTYIGAGPIQGATVCIEVTKRTCTGAQYTTTTAQDGTFSLTVDSGTTGVIRGEGGFDPVTNLQFDDDSFALSQPVTDQNFVVSPLSALINARETSEYEQLKSKLGLDSNFMIRFNNPLSNLDSEIYNKAAVVNSQLLVLYKILLDLHPTFTVGNAQYYLAADILERSGTETSLGDTAFIKELYKNVESELSLSSQQLIDLSAGTSAYMQKMYANSSNSLSHFTKVGFEELLQLLRSIVDGTSTSDEIDKLTFNTIDWINENTSWDGGAITDTEADISKTIYKLTHSGSSYYSVDNVNAKDTEFIIYVKEGDVIQFDPTSTVTSNHPFLLSTEVNDMDRSSDIGTSEGWDANSLTLTVGSDTPTTLYPHCQFHSGMYQSGKIVKVSSYDMSKIDVTNATAAMQVKGTVSKGPFKGASGHTYKVYLTSQGGSEHTHEFYEYPGLTFYMPADQGYHGAATATDDRMFKPKSHYASSDGGNDDGGGGY
ncbi:MAG: cadherin repeat domain-containing protein [Gammaproteobacteria bacterium]